VLAEVGVALEGVELNVHSLLNLYHFAILGSSFRVWPSRECSVCLAAVLDETSEDGVI
jgi:hypothetical protein